MSHMPEGLGPQPTCPRHPDRVSYVSCQRCGRPACPECQRPAAVGVHCVDCVNEANKGMRKLVSTNGVVIAARRPVVTYAVIVLCVVAYGLQYLVPGFSDRFMEFNAALGQEPWRMLTAGFLHSTASVLPLHLALNMFSLWFLGRALEPALGHWRFASVFLIGVVGGSVAQAMIPDPFYAGVGASGGIFAIGGAFLVELRKDRGQLTSMAVILGLNLAYGFVMNSSISWQAHVGGLVTGVLLGAVYASCARLKQRGLYHGVLTAVVAAVLVALGMFLGDQHLATVQQALY